MSRVLAAISRYAEATPDAVALKGKEHSHTLTYVRLEQEIKTVADLLKRHHVNVLGLMMDNTPSWAVTELAAISARIPVIPVPFFFSPRQIKHLITHANIDAVITDQQTNSIHFLLNRPGVGLDGVDKITYAGSEVSLIRISDIGNGRIPAGVSKVTFTSGTTGEPKGVCLTQESMETVAGSLLEATLADGHDRHLCLLPLATLLENIGGIYVPLLAGATCLLPGLSTVGMVGAAGLDVERMVTALTKFRASTCIMTPQMLHALVTVMERSAFPEADLLRYIAVGGAPVSVTLLRRAQTLGLPVFEGYGLSEAASVISVNRPNARKLGSVGKPLPHVRLSFADDGEIIVRGNLFSGYLGEPESAGERNIWPTGDLGYLDNEGFLYLTGRKKHIFITSFGRNVSPEWVERELLVEPAIAQCCVFGEARPFNVAVIVPGKDADRNDIENAVTSANKRLPDYAAISCWLVAEEPFSVANGLWTGTGRPRRRAIFNAYAEKINQLYEGI